MSILASLSMLKQEKNVVDYVTKPNELDNGQAQIVKEVQSLKQQVEKMTVVADEQRKTILDLITITHPLTIEQDHKERMEKEFKK